jgi:ubiquitin C-terminal hydrolase
VAVINVVVFSSPLLAKFGKTVDIQGSLFCDGGQHDSQELLRFVTNILHEAHNRVVVKPPYVEQEDFPDELPAAKADRLWQSELAREASAISDLFLGQLQSQVVCGKCGGTFYTYEPFLDLSLSLGKEGAWCFYCCSVRPSINELPLNLDWNGFSFRLGVISCV